VLIEVHQASLNHGDLNDAQSGRVPPGAVLGSDAAGVVIDGAGDGSGPEVGTRVVVLAQGAFADRAVVGVARWPRSRSRWIWLRQPRFRSPGLPHCERCVPQGRFWASACSSPAHPAAWAGSLSSWRPAPVHT
jgi:Alcohol dehydrogenase GroES-like domain